MAVLVAVIMLAVLLPVAAMGVDLGMQRVVRRDLQALADAVALSLARELDGRPRSALSDAIDQSVTDSVISRSIRENGRDVLGDAPTVVATWGAWDGVRFDATADPPTAVRVVADGAVEFGFAPGQGRASRTAYASAESAACFQLGSFAASLDAAAAGVLQGLIRPLLGSSTITAAGYQGLATSSLTLGELINAPTLQVGTVDELLTTGDITAGDFYIAAASVLDGQGRVAQGDVFRKAAVSAVGPMSIRMDRLFALSTDASDAVLATQFNALDLLLGAAFLANGEHLAGLANLQAGVPSVGVTNVDLSIIERPQRACGDEEAQTAQLKLTATAKALLNAAPLPLGNPLVTLRMKDADGTPTNDASVGIDIFLAGARGRLRSVTCNPDVFTGDVWTDLVRARLSGGIRVGGTIKVNLTVLGITLSKVDVPVTFNVALTADASRPANATPGQARLSLPPAKYGDHVEVDGTQTLLPYLSAAVVPGSLQAGPVTVRVLGSDVTVPTRDLVAAVDPVVSAIMTPLTSFVGATLNPLIDVVNTDLRALTTALGINAAGADFYPLPRPSCNEPRLRG